MLAGLLPSEGSKGECTPCLSRLPEAAGIPWLVAPCLQHSDLLLPSHLLLLNLISCLLMTHDYIGPAWITQKNLKILNFITSAKSFLLYKVTEQVIGVRMRISLGAIVQPATMGDVDSYVAFKGIR